MKAHIDFPPVDESYLKSKVEDGYYSNISEVIRDAVRRMREMEERHQLESLRAELALGLEQAERGDLIPYGPQLIEQALKSATENSQNKKPIKKSVKPT